MDTVKPLLLLALMSSACITVTTVNIGSKTSLEKQLMGEFEPLTEEEVLVSSVRAAPVGPTAGDDDRQAGALAARQRQLFNRDDLRSLKAAGCLGEALGAKLVARDCDKAKDASTAALVQRLLAEENADRATLVAWAVAADPGLSGQDGKTVSAMYHRLLAEQAAAGDWLQNDAGDWAQRP